MKRNATPLETSTALFFGKILANQHEIMKMLADAKASNSNESASEIYEQHVAAARKASPAFVDEFFNSIV